MGGSSRQDTAYIISSSAKRAAECAGVLAVQLGLPSEFEQIIDLWSGADSEYRGYIGDEDGVRDCIDLIDARVGRADGLVVVTHKEVTEGIPPRIVRREFGREVNLPEIDKGRAVHIDLIGRRYEIIPV